MKNSKILMAHSAENTEQSRAVVYTEKTSAKAEVSKKHIIINKKENFKMTKAEMFAKMTEMYIKKGLVTMRIVKGIETNFTVTETGEILAIFDEYSDECLYLVSDINYCLNSLGEGDIEIFAELLKKEESRNEK